MDVDTDSSTDEQSIPKVRFDEVNGKLKDTNELLSSTNSRLEQTQTELNSLKGEIETLKKPAPAKYTRTQLQTAIDNEQLTKVQADEFMDTQNRQEVTNEVTSQVSALLETQTRANSISSQLDSYTAKIEGLTVQGHANRDKVITEFNYLVNTLGQDPNSLATELAATRAAFGSVDKIVKQHDARETHQEVGGLDQSDTNEPDLYKNLDAKTRDYYKGMVFKGILTEEDVKADLKYKRV